MIDSNRALLESFRADLELRGLAESTISTYIAQVGWFERWTDKDLRKATDSDLKAYLADLRARRKKTGTIMHVFAALSTFYDYLEAEREIAANPVPAIRKRYLQQYKSGTDRDERRCITVEEAARLVITAMDSKKQAVIILFLKTGMRRRELAALDVSDVDMIEKVITLKPTAKRSNRTLFFDNETAAVLQRWLTVRSGMGYQEGPLFPGLNGNRMSLLSIANLVREHSKRVGVGDPGLGTDHISPHYFRVFFTTQLLRAGMPRHYVQELRGDVSAEAIDIYTRVDREELRRSYLAHIPQLGV